MLRPGYLRKVARTGGGTRRSRTTGRVRGYAGKYHTRSTPARLFCRYSPFDLSRATTEFLCIEKINTQIRDRRVGSTVVRSLGDTVISGLALRVLGLPFPAYYLVSTVENILSLEGKHGLQSDIPTNEALIETLN